jgi:hypothetical protein
MIVDNELINDINIIVIVTAGPGVVVRLSPIAVQPWLKSTKMEQGTRSELFPESLLHVMAII